MKKEKSKLKVNKDNMSRPPIITVMGHVDHGKTTLIDYLRKSNIVDREKGGITQSIRAFSIKYKENKFTFIDTPGHEAFSQMRERGSKLTDIILLVIAADDGVKPQTKEVINLALKDNIELIVAINKVDLPNANVEKIKRELGTAGIYLEGFGGKTVFVEISAKTGQGVDNLLDMISLVSEMQEIKTNNDISAGTILESYIQKNSGPESLVVVQSGTFKVGSFVSGDEFYGKIRAIIDDTDKRILEATSSMPVRIVGLDKVLKCGEIIHAYETRQESTNTLNNNIDLNLDIDNTIEDEKESTDELEENNLNWLDTLMKESKEENSKPKLNVVLKADFAGSLEAINEMLSKNIHKDIQLNIVKSSTGEISESDIELAKSTRSIIIGFNSPLSARMKTLALREKVNVMIYGIIYELVDDLVTAAETLIPPESIEVLVGVAEVIEVFKLSNNSYVAGSLVKDGKIIKNYKCFISRSGERVCEAKITSIRHHKDEIKEALKGVECGIILDSNFEFKIGDKVSCIRIEKG